MNEWHIEIVSCCFSVGFPGVFPRIHFMFSLVTGRYFPVDDCFNFYFFPIWFMVIPSVICVIMLRYHPWRYLCTRSLLSNRIPCRHMPLLVALWLLLNEFVSSSHCKWKKVLHSCQFIFRVNWGFKNYWAGVFPSFLSPITQEWK
jgi:hypothetical protein